LVAGVPRYHFAVVQAVDVVRYLAGG
jgi:hypothetical protein